MVNRGCDRRSPDKGDTQRTARVTRRLHRRHEADTSDPYHRPQGAYCAFESWLTDGMTSPWFETSPAHDPNAGPIDPAQIRSKPGVRRETDHPVQFCTIHGYRRAYVSYGEG